MKKTFILVIVFALCLNILPQGCVIAKENSNFTGNWERRNISDESSFYASEADIEISNQKNETFEFTFSSYLFVNGNSGELNSTAQIVGKNRAICEYSSSFGTATLEFVLENDTLSVDIIDGNKRAFDFGNGVSINGNYKQNIAKDEYSFSKEETQYDLYKELIGTYKYYAVYDINKDGSYELFLCDNVYGGFSKVDVYSYGFGNCHFIGSCTSQYGLYKFDGNGVLLSGGGTGVSLFNRWYINDENLCEDTVTYLSGCFVPGHEEFRFNDNIITQNEYGNIENDLVKIDFCSSADLSLLDVLKVKPPITVMLNGHKLNFDQSPIMQNDRVMVPIRVISEAMGDKVTWNDKDQSALIQHPDRILMLKKNNNNISIIKNIDMKTWEYYSLDVPVQEINGRTLVPLRAVVECLGADVSWDDEEQTVYISYEKIAEQTISSTDVAQLNACYSALYEFSDFSDYSKNIDETFSRRNPNFDALAMAWNDIWLSTKTQYSGLDNAEYMMKVMLLEILADLPDTNELDISEELDVVNYIGEVQSFASQPGKFVDFSDIEKFGKVSVQTANALTKLNDAIGTLGDIISWTKLGADVASIILSDYTNGINYVEAMRTSFKAAGINDRVLYKVLDNIEDEYTYKWLTATRKVADTVAISESEELVNLLTGGAFGLVTYAKDTVNSLLGVNKRFEAVRVFNCIYCFNGAVDISYNSLRNEIASNKTDKILDYMYMFNLQKVIKKKAYESMREIYTREDMKEYLSDELTSIENASYMVWK